MRCSDLAFFDVDSLELASAGSCDLCPRPRMEPVRPALETIHQLASQKGWAVVMTTCCSGRMPDGGTEGLLYVPMGGQDRRWEATVGDHRRFYLAKPAFGSPAINLERHAFDVFEHNQNALRLIELLQARRWVVFGNGLDLCVDAVVTGLVSTGADVSVISDLLVSSATGTAQSRSAKIEEWEGLGVHTPVLAEILAALG